jgi:RNA polymerase sigma-70 factor (ECF subfamily)
MATQSTSMFIDATALCAAPNPPQQTCPEVLSTLYTAHYRHVLRVCRRFFRQPEDAEDAAAEVFLKLHRVLETKDEAVPFRPWVSQVAARHCIDLLRQRKREKDSRVDRADLSEVRDDSTPSPLSRVLRWEEQLEVRDQVIHLPEKYKVPVVLRYYKEMSYSEIARALKKRLPTIRMMIFRAKQQLRRNLRREPTRPEQSRSVIATQPAFLPGNTMPCSLGTESRPVPPGSAFT